MGIVDMKYVDFIVRKIGLYDFSRRMYRTAVAHGWI